MNFSESRQNRSRENREKSKNRFFPPPLVMTVLKSTNISPFSFLQFWNWWVPMATHTAQLPCNYWMERDRRRDCTSLAFQQVSMANHHHVTTVPCHFHHTVSDYSIRFQRHERIRSIRTIYITDYEIHFFHRRDWHCYFVIQKSVCVCVCMREGKRERKSIYVYERDKEMERKRGSERERKRERECVFLIVIVYCIGVRMSGKRTSERPWCHWTEMRDGERKTERREECKEEKQ